MLVFGLLALLAQDTTAAYGGRANQIKVHIPRVEAVAVVDGRLDDPVWQRAARLTDFSQYQPSDGRPAEEPTEVLVWYAPDAIYFGIRAREVHGDVVRATSANRDNIGSEDHVQILLDTHNDRRLAFLFGVNALGVQQDGTRSDAFGGGAGGRFEGGGGVGGMNLLEGNVDLNPDFLFDSKGRLVEGGYEVEIRIPFKSLRYRDGDDQVWGINVLRRVQHSGFQDSWTPAVRGNASFLGQSGTLEGLHGLKRGLVLEVTPTATGRYDGVRENTGVPWSYSDGQEIGADVRWGIKQNLTLNATWNPDFSQVEADVGQVVLNERFALFFPEKRPFFLDGLELFDTPNQLIYTRKIDSPQGGFKLAGKVGDANVGALVAADDDRLSQTGNTPVFGIARVRRDLGRNSSVGAVFTTREDGRYYSRLTGGDVRIYHSKLYYVELQAVQSWVEDRAGARSGPLLEATWDRTGRRWGFHYTLKAIAPDFQAAAGFVNRTGILQASAFNRLSGYGKQGALLQTYTGLFALSRLWNYSRPGDGPIEGSESVFPSATLRGGWQLNATLSRSFFSFDPAIYAGVEVLHGSDTVAFAVPGQERNQWTAQIGMTTPTWRHLTATAAVGRGEVPIFREATPGTNTRVDLILDLRPTAALRGAFQFTRLTLSRKRDGSRASTETIPRLKLEYQLSRSIFFRFVGQFAARNRAPLEDRSGNPILVDGVTDVGDSVDEFSMDWLFSYRPVPGTLVYLGYGSIDTEREDFQLLDPRRTTRKNFGFFGKLSYLFRL